MEPLVDAPWLLEHINDKHLRVVDCRFDLGDRAAGRSAYCSGHLPGAVYLDLEEDLSGRVAAHGGRHPLPAPEKLSRTLSQVGIGPQTMVVAYDENMTFAPRLWWLLRFLGHEQAAVLDGALPAWRRAGGSLTEALPAPEPAEFTPHPRPELLASADEVGRGAPGTCLLDARAFERYTGAVEPMDARAGHIPGAISLPWASCLQEDGTFRPRAELRGLLAPFLDRPVIASCGSGVTACCLLLALALAGHSDARLYAGSFSDWISWPERPVREGAAP